jgi:CRISPR-associated protein Csc1
MNIYRCRLTFLEPTFFSSQEISNYYQTAPLVGNYALAYALGLCRAPYFNDGAISYRADLSEVNHHGIYVTPATLDGAPRFTLAQFNAQPDAYWYAMANNTIVTRLDGTWAEKRGSKWYLLDGSSERGRAVGLENRPQHGHIRFLSIGNVGVFYVLSREPYRPPAYVRLGKFMSKARVEATVVPFTEVQTTAMVPFLLNPNDFAPETRLTVFDLVNVPPTPLIRNAVLEGRFYRLSETLQLPAGMRFGVEALM